MKKNFRFRFTMTRAIDFVVTANRKAEAEQFVNNYVCSRCLGDYDSLLTISHSVRPVRKKDILPYDMVFCRPDEIVRNLEVT